MTVGELIQALTAFPKSLEVHYRDEFGLNWVSSIERKVKLDDGSYVVVLSPKDKES